MIPPPKPMDLLLKLLTTSESRLGAQEDDTPDAVLAMLMQVLGLREAPQIPLSEEERRMHVGAKSNPINFRSIRGGGGGGSGPSIPG